MPHQAVQPFYARGEMFHVSPSALKFRNDPLEERNARAPGGAVTVSTQVSTRTSLTVSQTQETGMTRATGRRLGPVPLTLEVHSDDGAVVTLSGLEFFITEADTGDMTFSNESLPAPWHFLITLGLKTGKMRLELSLNYAGLSVGD